MISEDDLFSVREYIKICEGIKRSTFHNKFKRIQWSISLGESGKGESFDQLDQEGEESLIAMSSKIRRIYMQGERTHFGRVANIISRYSKDDDILKNVKRCKELYEQKLSRHPGFFIKIGGKDLVYRDIIDNLFNGEYFHGDKEKTSLLESMLLKKLPKLQLCMAFEELLGVVLPLGENAKKFLEEVKT